MYVRIRRSASAPLRRLPVAARASLTQIDSLRRKASARLRELVGESVPSGATPAQVLEGIYKAEALARDSELVSLHRRLDALESFDPASHEEAIERIAARAMEVLGETPSVSVDAFSVAQVARSCGMAVADLLPENGSIRWEAPAWMHEPEEAYGAAFGEADARFVADGSAGTEEIVRTFVNPDAPAREEAA